MTDSPTQGGTAYQNSPHGGETLAGLHTLEYLALKLCFVQTGE